MHKVIFVCNSFDFVLSHRAKLVKELVSVYSVSIVGLGSPGAEKALQQLGVSTLVCESAKNSFSVFNFFINLLFIRKLLFQMNPKLIISVGLRSNLNSAIANFSSINCFQISIFTGLGKIFSDQKYRLLRYGLQIAFGLIVVRRNQFTVFQTCSDCRKIFRFVKTFQNKPLLTRGSGVNLNDFILKEYSNVTSSPAIAVGFMSRLLEEKGVLDFLSIASSLNSDEFEFVVGGGLFPGVSEVVVDQLSTAHAGGLVNWLGLVTQPADFFKEIDVFVYPAIYGDGVPKVLLEASASGCYSICYDSPGVRSVVACGRNGFITGRKDLSAVISELRRFRLLSGSRRREISRLCRLRALALFSEDTVVLKIVGLTRRLVGSF